MKKSDYRDFFAKCKKYIKLSAVCKDIGIPRQNLSAFMQGYDYALSVDKLHVIYESICNILEKIA